MGPVGERARSTAAVAGAAVAFVLCGCIGPGEIVMREARAAEGAFYMSPDGNDDWSGALPDANAARTDGPLATLARARDAVRDYRRARGGVLDRPVTVRLRGGTYHLDEAVVLSPEDSGTAECPVTYVAYEDEKPVLSGGRVVTGWERAVGGVWSVRLPEVERGEWSFRQLFVKRPGRDYFVRRYRPCLGAFVIAGLTDAPTYKTTMRHRQSQDEFRFFPGDIEEWENLGDVEIVALHDWSASRLRVREIDRARHVVKFTGFPVYRIGHWYKDGRNPYYVENVKTAFARPGEWYLDRPTGTLSYIPRAGEDLETLTFVAPRTEKLVVLAGDAEAGRFVEHVCFKGIAFRHTSWKLQATGYSSGQGMVGLPAAVEARAARSCRFERCEFSNLGAYAVRLGNSCRGNELVGCRMFDLGGGGVMVGGQTRGAKGPSAPEGNVVANNVISDGGLVHFSAHGVWVGIAARTRVAHNVIRRFPYSNVSAGWSWNDRPTSCRENVIESNHIHDAMMLLADGGGIYTLGFQPGTVIRGNHIHAVHRSKFAGRAQNNGIFFDEGSKGFLVEDNVIYDTSGDAVRFNRSGRDRHDFRGNSLGVEPDAPAFPKDVAAAAGLEPAFRDLDARPVEITPPPIYSMELPQPPPPPKPKPLAWDFEKTPVGRAPSRGVTVREDGKGTVRVTDETAAKGGRSLKFTDAPGLAKSFYPYARFSVGFEPAAAAVSFSLRLERGADVSIDCRQKEHSETAMRVRLSPDGTLSVGGGRSMDVPFGKWFGVELAYAPGGGSTRTYDVTVTLPGAAPRRFRGLPLGVRDFRRLDSVVVSSGATGDAVFYIDDVRIVPRGT